MDSNSQTPTKYTVPESGVVISEMPLVEPDYAYSPYSPALSLPPTTETRVKQSNKIPSSETSARLSKMDEQSAEEAYKQKMGKITQMLKNSSLDSPEIKNTEKSENNKTETCQTMETDNIPIVKVSISNSPEKPQPDQIKKAIDTALEKSNNSLRCSAEMRIAQIYKNSDQIIRALNKLKETPTQLSQNQINKPVKINPKILPKSPQIPVISAQMAEIREDPELRVLTELEKLDKMIAEKKQKSRASSVKSTPNKSQNSPGSAENKRISAPPKENISQSLVKTMTNNDLRKIVKNRINYPNTTKNENSYSSKNSTQNGSKVPSGIIRQNQLSSGYSSVKSTAKKPFIRNSIKKQQNALKTAISLIPTEKNNNNKSENETKKQKIIKPLVNLRIQTTPQESDAKNLSKKEPGTIKSCRPTIRKNLIIIEKSACKNQVFFLG